MLERFGKFRDAILHRHPERVTKTQDSLPMTTQALQEASIIDRMEDPSVEDARKHAREHWAYKKKWKTVNLGVVTISGETGTGKTTLAEYIAQIYGIPDIRNTKIGQLIRFITGMKNAIRPIDRPPSLDVFVDELQEEIIRRANPNSLALIEGRRAAEKASQEKAKNPELKKLVISIGLTGSPEVIVARIKKGKRPDLSESEISKDRKNRAEDDKFRWYGLDSKEANPYDPKYFDLIVDTDGKNKDEVFDMVHNYFVKEGYVKYMGEKSEKELKSIGNQGTIFEAENPPQSPIA